MEQIYGILEAEKGFYGRSRWVGGGKGLYGWVVYGRVLGKRVIGRGLYRRSAAPELWTPVGKEVKQALTGAIVACSQLRPFLRSGHQPAPGLVVLGECPAAALST